MVDRAIDSAMRIRKDEKRSFVLAGICIAADQLMLQDQARRIGGLLKMTKVGQMLQEEFDQLESQVNESRKLLQQQTQQIQQQGQQIQQQGQQLRQQDQQLRQQDQQIQQQDQQIQQQERQLRQLQESRAVIIKKLLSENFSPEKICLITGADMDEIKMAQNSFRHEPAE